MFVPKKKSRLVQKIDHLSVGVCLPVCLRKTKLYVLACQLSEISDPWHLVHNGYFKISARKVKKLSHVCFDVRTKPSFFN